MKIKIKMKKQLKMKIMKLIIIMEMHIKEEENIGLQNQVLKIINLLIVLLKKIEFLLIKEKKI